MNTFLYAAYALEGYLLGVVTMYVYLRTQPVYWHRLVQDNKTKELYLWINAFLWPVYLVKVIASLFL